VKGEAYFTYTLTLYGVLHVARVRPSPDTHLHKPNMNEQLKLSTIFRRNTCCCKFRIILPSSMNYFMHILCKVNSYKYQKLLFSSPNCKPFWINKHRYCVLYICYTIDVRNFRIYKYSILTIHVYIYIYIL